MNEWKCIVTECPFYFHSAQDGGFLPSPPQLLRHGRGLRQIHRPGRARGAGLHQKQTEWVLKQRHGRDETNWTTSQLITQWHGRQWKYLSFTVNVKNAFGNPNVNKSIISPMKARSWDGRGLYNWVLNAFWLGLSILSQ